jgi:Tfp pilus assembly PilM family ATPase
MGKREPKVKGSGGKPCKEAVFIEIGNDWIKMIQVETGKAGVTITRAHLAPLDEEVNIADNIAAALKSRKFSSSTVLACLPRQAVNVRLLELPSTDSAEIADMVDLQIGRQTPYSRDEILSDYKELGRTRQGTYTRIMLAIVQRSIVRERFYELESAGLDVKQMGVSSEGLLNWFLHHTRDKNHDKAMAVVDVDSFYTQVLVVHHEKVVFTKSILVGAKQLQETRDESLERLSQEVQSALQSCREEHRDGEIASVTVSGAGVHVEGLTEALGNAISLPCESADCLADVRLSKGVGDLADSRYATASLTSLIGMAMNPRALEFNLVPDVVRMRKTLLQSAKATSAMASLIMAVMVSASLYAVLSCAYRGHKIKELRKQVSMTQPDVVKVERMIEVIREAGERQNSRLSPVNLFPAIHNCVPKDVYFETVDVDAEAKKIALAGTAPVRKDIRELIRLLNDSPLFANVAEDGRVTMDQEERLKFRVVGMFEEEE